MNTQHALESLFNGKFRGGNFSVILTSPTNRGVPALPQTIHITLNDVSYSTEDESVVSDAITLAGSVDDLQRLFRERLTAKQ